MTTTVTILEQETRVTVAQPDVINVSVYPRNTSLTISNDQGPQGATGNSGLSPVFTRQGTLSPVVGQQRFYVERSGTVSVVRASVGTAPTGSSIVVDLMKNGSEVASLAIPNGGYTVASTSTFTVDAGDYFTVNISSVGSTNPGADLTVAITIN